MKNSGIPLLNQAKIAELMHLEGNSEKGQLAARLRRRGEHAQGGIR